MIVFDMNLSFIMFFKRLLNSLALSCLYIELLENSSISCNDCSERVIKLTISVLPIIEFK